ncbi:MAG TPA: S41 family peptidase [Candidatus Cloacimonadota bacterium]|jgi:carboxyl-terminal processing protease|nr:S41 family peptidase [Candidatus Cloacimonadales bacterium]HPY96833.1 S41 family peptidase [Candidatus Cloacimonadota bacterium]HQB40130.1 S41 family peptidase [Candidatus Cloacimonadota bacterium]
MEDERRSKMKVLRKNKIIFYSILIIWIFAGTLIFNYSIGHAQSHNDTDDLYKYLKLFRDTMYMVKQNYVEELKIQDLFEYAVNGMLNDVDPHTNFMKPEDFEDFQTSTKGEFGGLGITIDKQGEYITVVSPIEGTPAYKMGIIAGDKIVKVDGANVVGISTDDVIKKMRGDKGTKVVITISRPGVNNPLDFEIIRDIIKIKSIPYAFKLDNGIGYVRIRQFNANTTQELRQSIDNLEKEGIRGLLIDLRFNPGGLLNEAVDTVNEFIGPNKLVVSTKGRLDYYNQNYNTRFNRMRTGYPVIVLVNEASASASEIFAGSLQDWDKGLVVGKTTFGKGSVQQLFPLSEGYGIKITISKYYIKSGRCIHKDINDKILKGKEVTADEKEMIEKDINEHIYKTVNGRTVYGGGGITPDIEIEQDKLTELEMEIRRLNLFFEYSIDYYTKNKQSITEDFVATDALIQDFLSFGKNKGLKYESSTLDSSYAFIRNSLTSSIIDKKFGEIAGYKAGLAIDRQLMDAISIFDKYPTLDKMFEYAKTVQTTKR